MVYHWVFIFKQIVEYLVNFLNVIGVCNFTLWCTKGRTQVVLPLGILDVKMSNIDSVNIDLGSSYRGVLCLSGRNVLCVLS